MMQVFGCDHEKSNILLNSIVVCVFIATGMYLLSYCLAMIRGHGKQANSSELLKVFSLQPNPNSYKENNSAQDHSVQEPETWKT
jgi:apolipoprotein N-acyltransferase